MISVTRLIEQRIRLADDLGGAGSAGDARRVWPERRTLLVVVEDGEGHTGLGEAAPLPDYSPDSFDDAFSALSPLVGTPLGDGSRRAPESATELWEVTQALASPAARFALESALVELSSKRRGEPAWWLLARLHAELGGSDFDGESFDGGRAVATLLPPEPEGALEHAAQAYARGIRCLKAKVGRRDAWTEELELLRSLRQRFPKALLRVDANQSFSPHELWQRLPALRDLELEWLEEPVPKFPRGLEKLEGFPLALDESLQIVPPSEAALREHGVRAFVLKPTTLGGYLRSFELANLAGSAGLAVVASHAYEGPVGFSAIAALSIALGSGRPADGLDRHAALADAPSLPAFDAQRGRVHPWSEPGFGLDLDALLAARPVVREVGA